MPVEIADNWSDPHDAARRGVPLSDRLRGYNNDHRCPRPPFYTFKAMRQQLADARQPGDKGKRAIRRLIVARSDATSAQDAATLFVSLVQDMKRDWELYVPLMHAAIIAYGKPFAGAKEGAGAIKQCWCDYADQKFVDLHADVMEARHKLVAHSDPTVRRVRVIPAPLELGDGSEVPRFSLEVASYVWDREKLVSLANMAFMLGKHLNEVIDSSLPGHFPDRTFEAPFDFELPEDKPPTPAP